MAHNGVSSAPKGEGLWDTASCVEAGKETRARVTCRVNPGCRGQRERREGEREGRYSRTREKGKI